LFKVKIFDKEIQTRDYYCQLDNLNPTKVREPYINLYINITNQCNANCTFCCNSSNKNNNIIFDVEKFKTVIDEINNSINIHKVSFTGGEPTLYIELLKTCLTYVKNKNENIFTVINSNGFKLSQLSDMLSIIDSIALSRHHYLDNINQTIFKSQLVPSEHDIAQFPDKTKLHLSCNLMKDYIGNKEEIIKYLEWASKISCNDIGFVSLMPINDYCKKQFIDFKDINFESTPDVFITQNWNYQNLCRCRNYMYIANNTEIINVYSRYYKNPSYSGNALVYDGTNLKLGFNGEIIY
jgi:molybdenum cofactor biosynthesis enzyme MoaA